MAITFVASAQSSNNGGTMNVTVPSQVVDGDFALLFYTVNSLSTAPTLAGWILDGSNVQSTGMTSNVFRRFMSTSDAGTIVTAPSAGGQRIGQMMVFRGVDPTTPVEARANNTLTTGGASVNHTTPAASVVTTGASVVQYVGAVPSTGPITMTLPSGVTQRRFTSQTGTNLPASWVGHYTTTSTAGDSVGGKTWVASLASQGIHRTLVLKPDAGFVPPPPPPADTPDLLQFENGASGEVATAASTGVTSVTGTNIVHSADAAVHGIRGLTGTDGSGYLRLDKPSLITGASGNHTGSLYVRPRQIDTATVRVLQLYNGAGLLVSIRFNATNRITISDSSGSALAQSAVAWEPDKVYRIDWQWNGTTNIMTVRIYADTRSEWSSDPTDEISAQANTGAFAPFDRFHISPTFSSTGTGVLQTDIDTFRLLNGTSAWPAAFAPVVQPGTVLHSWAGAATDSGFRIKARLQGATSVRLGVSTSAVMASPTFSTAQVPSADQMVDVTVSGLTAATQYYYRWYDTPSGGTEVEIGTIGTVKTQKTAGTAAASFKFAATSSIDTGAADIPATSLLTWGPDFGVLLGDFHYAQSTSTTYAGHLSSYQAQISAVPQLASLLRDVSWSYVPSANEAGVEGGDSNNTYTAAHIEAYKKIVPYYPLGDTSSVTRSRHQAWSVGRVRFIMLDTRNQDRSPGLDPDTPSKTMLGAAQKSWLKNELIRTEFVKVILCDAAWMGDLFRTSFELAPAGTSVPTEAAAGDGYPFSDGADGTDSTLLTTNAVPAAIANGALAAQLSIGNTTGTTYRSWDWTGGTLHARMYVYLDSLPPATLALMGPRTGANVNISRLQITTTGSMQMTNGSTVIGSGTVGTIPLSALVRIEASWDLAAGTGSADMYLGESTTPITNGSLSFTGQTFSSSTAALATFGSLVSGPTNYAFYTDSWMASSLYRPGPVTAPTHAPDRWWSYSNERQEIVNFIAQNQLRVVLVHGDLKILGRATAAQNTWGNFPVYCVGPFSSTGGVAEPYFTATWNSSGGAARHYGRVTVTDVSGTIQFVFSGWDGTAEVQRITQTDSFSIAASVTHQGAGEGQSSTAASGSGNSIPPPLDDLPARNVTGVFLDESGSPVSGTVTLIPPVDQVLSDRNDTIVRFRSRTVDLVDGSFSARLVAFGTYASWTCVVTESSGRMVTTMSFRVIAGAGTVNIADYVV